MPRILTGVQGTRLIFLTRRQALPQLSLAIGKEGQNARLAAKLTGWKIDIKSQSQADADAEMNLADENMHAYIPDVDTEEQQ